jgi:ERCC4-type nuclease
MFKVIIDTREKKPWSFNSSQVNDVEIKKLDTGDYTVDGLEKILCIERKMSIGEFVNNMTDPRFERELVRMEAFKERFLIMEFDYDDVKQFPLGSNIPQATWSKIKVKSPFIMKYISEVQIKHGVHVVLAGNTAIAEHIATNIMKRVVEKYGSTI